MAHWDHTRWWWVNLVLLGIALCACWLFCQCFCRLSGMQDYLILSLLAYSMEQSPWEAIRFSAGQKIPSFYGTHRFFTAFTSAHHLSLSWASVIQSIPPHPTSRRSILILSSHLHLGQPSGIFLTYSPSKTLYTLLLSPIRATCPTHLILLDFITQTILGEEYRPLSSSLCSFLDSLVTSSLLSPNILLNTLFSNTLSLCPSLNVSDQVSHPHKKWAKL